VPSVIVRQLREVLLAVPLTQAAVGGEEFLADQAGLVLGDGDPVGRFCVAHQALGVLPVEEAEIHSLGELAIVFCYFLHLFAEHAGRGHFVKVFAPVICHHHLDLSGNGGRCPQFHLGVVGNNERAALWRDKTLPEFAPADVLHVGAFGRESAGCRADWIELPVNAAVGGHTLQEACCLLRLFLE
jgi:hypothetical protein